MTKISIVNRSTQFSDADLPALTNALQIQVSGDWFKAWGSFAQLFHSKTTDPDPPADHWVLGIFDNSDIAGALGYHDVTPTGLPLGKAFVATTVVDGGTFSVTVGHELLEMLGDPDINLTAEFDDAKGNPSKFYAYEVCDAVEADNLAYIITIPTGFQGAGASVLVSDFVLPSWFQSFAPGPYAHKTPLSSPFELAPGGYIGVLDLANLSAGWQQQVARNPKASPNLFVRSRPHVGSRRERRKLPRSQWQPSTYNPGTAGTMAGTKE